MLETSNLLSYSPEQLSLMVECIDDKLKSVRGQIERREYIILKSDDLSESLERNLRKEITEQWKIMEELHGIRIAVVTNQQHVLKNLKPVL